MVTYIVSSGDVVEGVRVQTPDLIQERGDKAQGRQPVGQPHVVPQSHHGPKNGRAGRCARFAKNPDEKASSDDNLFILITRINESTE